jgi:uncharacterized protein
MQQAFVPVQVNERISIMDSLRGIAILGIFIANLGSGFSFYDASLNNSGPFFHSLDKTFQFWQHVFIEGKFYSIFSLLFGWGMAIQLKRSEVKGLTPVKFMRRRLGFMFLLGLAHLLLLWTGDIVAFYALVGFVFLWVRKWNDRKLFITAVVMLCLPVLIYFLRMKWNVLAAPAGIMYMTGEKVDSVLTGFKSFDEFLINLKTGNYFFQLKSLVAGVFYRFGDLLFQSRALKVLGMFTLGYLLGRNDRYKQLIANSKLLWMIAVVGLLIGLPANYQLSKLMETGLYYQLKIEGFYQSIAYALGVGPLALAYVALFFLFAQTAFGKKVTAVLQPVGKMAFTNYITHSIIGTLVFYGAGLGLVREVGPVYYTLLAFLVFIGQIILSTLWLKYFNYGPIEWLWRSATYKKWQPLKKTPHISNA